MHQLLPKQVETYLSSPGRILIVDDEESICSFVQLLLSKDGHRVTAAPGVDAALTLLSEEDYDVALVDLHMPIRNGLELLDALGESESSVVGILLTGTRDVVAAVSGVKRGAFDYLPKPVDPAQLRWTVARAIDVSRTRRRGRSLERVVVEWSSTFQACPDGLLIIDAEGIVLRANLAVGRAVDKNPADLVGRPVEEALPSGFGVVVRSLESRGSKSGATSGPLTDLATGRAYVLSVSPIGSNTGSSPGIIVVLRDLTDLVRAEETRILLLRQQMTTREDEQTRISRELHDGIGQCLVSLAFGLTAAAAESTHADTVGRLEKLAAIATEALDDVRRLAHGLRPIVLDDLGLLPAITRLAALFKRVHGIRAEVVSPSGQIPRLPTELESTLYRIVQEALTNVAKHSRARTVDIVLEPAESSIRVMIIDDGEGFAFPTGFRATGLGLAGIRERVEMFGGVCRIGSDPGQGTTIDVLVPLNGGRL